MGSSQAAVEYYHWIASGLFAVLLGCSALLVYNPIAAWMRAYEASLQTLLISMRSRAVPRDFVMQQFLFASIFFAVTYVVKGSVLLGLIAAAGGVYLPWRNLNAAHRKYMRLFESQFVETLGILSACLRANQSFSQAVDEVVKRSLAPTRDEFKSLAEEMRHGIPVAEALDHMVARMRVTCVDAFANAVKVTAPTGGSLARIFDQLAENLRENNRLERAIETMTAQGRLQGNILGMLPIVLAAAMYFLEPDLIRPLFTTTPGYVILSLIIACEVAGLYLIRKATRIPL